MKLPEVRYKVPKNKYQETWFSLFFVMLKANGQWLKGINDFIQEPVSRILYLS
jgi:hypothetical protein